jgi:hypothetical protein
MALTTAGAQFAPKAIFNLNSPTLFTSGANLYLGVGDSSTAFAIGQTDLQAVTNKLRKQATASEASGVVTATATWGTSEGNFEWYEWGTFNASSGGTMLQRKVESPSLGTKTSAQVWTLTATLTFTAA